MKHCRKSNFECKNCLKKFSSFPSLRKHKYNNCINFVCSLCGFTSKGKYHLNLHLLRVHNQIEDGVLHCDICKMTFQKKGSFEKHMECHRTSSFKCNHCPQTFGDHISLNKHLITHRRHRCTKCPMVFHHSYDLKVRF